MANSGGGFVKREPVNAVKNQVLDKCRGNLFKPNHRDPCKARNIVCHNCNSRGHFVRFCKQSSVNQIKIAYEFTQFETNVITKLEEQDNEEFGIFVIKNIMDKEGKENKKMLEIAMGNSRW